jgi:hypothetical protein
LVDTRASINTRSYPSSSRSGVVCNGRGARLHVAWRWGSGKCPGGERDSQLLRQES